MAHNCYMYMLCLSFSKLKNSKLKYKLRIICWTKIMAYFRLKFLREILNFFKLEILNISGRTPNINMIPRISHFTLYLYL